MLEDLLNIFMSGDNPLLRLGFYSTIIAMYSIFIYFFYRFLARRNIISLNLNQYNRYSNPAIVKFFAALFYIIEYIILLPIVTFIWFGFLSILILMLSENLDIQYVLLISASLVAAVRVTSYIKEDLSRDLAKMLPFSLISIAITSGVGFFSASSLSGRISEIPSLFSNITYFLLFIVGIELIMRVITFILSSLNLVKSIQEESAVMEESSAVE